MFDVGYEYDAAVFDIQEDPIGDARAVDLDVEFVQRWQRAKAEWEACQQILAGKWNEAQPCR